VWRMIRKVKRARDGDGEFFRDYDAVTFNDATVSSVLARYETMAVEMQRASELLSAGGDNRAVAYPNPTHTCKWDCDFRLVCDMFDDGSRAEDAVSDLYVTTDPYERYKVLG